MARFSPRERLHLSPRFRLLFADQGENNLQFDAGNSADKTGYACLFPAMIADWRATWSAVPGTTDPLAPFVFATIADGSDESFGVNMAALRHAQSASYGTVPNPLMPMTAQALTHALGDPWDADSCGNRGCCVDDYIDLGPTCVGDHRGFWSVNQTGWFQGCVHPRPKGYVGRQMAQVTAALAYARAPAPAPQLSGPILAGCTAAGAVLTLRFNASLLAGAPVTWSANASRANETTALYVLAGATLPADYARFHHVPSSDYKGCYANGNELGVEGWVPVNAVVSGADELTVDLLPLNNSAPTAVRYAWGTGGWGTGFSNRMCCGPTVDVAVQPCAPDSCPLHGGGLPGVPFVAEITPAGRCKCALPQVCDA